MKNIFSKDVKQSTAFLTLAFIGLLSLCVLLNERDQLDKTNNSASVFHFSNTISR